jgi:beta-mannosidase
LETLQFHRKSCVLKISFGKSEFLHYFVKPKDLKLSKSEIEIKTEKAKDGFMITLFSKTLQKNVFLIANEKGTFEDNYFDLLPNEPKTILFSTESKSPPKLEYKTLNQFIK